MKKGFTIVEIIISVSILLIVGISTTFFILSNKNDNKLESITKEVLEAANLYAAKEVDGNGKIYLNEVRKSKKGIQIPLNNLVSKGYISEEQENQIKELTNDENYYIMLLEGNNDGYDYCGDGKIFSLASWNYKDKDVYLCNKETQVSLNKDSLEYIIDANLVLSVGNIDILYEPFGCVENQQHILDGNLLGLNIGYCYKYGFNIQNIHSFSADESIGETLSFNTNNILTTVNGLINNGLWQYSDSYNEDQEYMLEEVNYESYSYRGKVNNYFKLTSDENSQFKDKLYRIVTIDRGTDNNYLHIIPENSVNIDEWSNDLKTESEKFAFKIRNNIQDTNKNIDLYKLYTKQDELKKSSASKSFYYFLKYEDFVIAGVYFTDTSSISYYLSNSYIIEGENMWSLGAHDTSFLASDVYSYLKTGIFNYDVFIKSESNGFTLTNAEVDEEKNRPAIVIQQKNGTKIIGNGTKGNPYQFIED